jgi:putative membrane protein
MADSPQQDPRVFLAAERTFLAWIRTGLALMGFGFVIARFGLFLRELRDRNSQVAAGHTQASVWFGVAMVLVGVAVEAFASIRYYRLMHNLAQGTGEFHRPSSLALSVSGVLGAVGLAVCLYLVLMR